MAKLKSDEKIDFRSFYEKKADDFVNFSLEDKKYWYFENYPKMRSTFKYRWKLKKLCRFLVKLKLPLYLSFLRWMFVDFLRGKSRRFWGIYQFIALPGEGKTLSMVAHMERAREIYSDIIIATNFNYKHQQFFINHWLDIIKVSKYAQRNKKKCIIAIDEIHVTFDSAEWQKFPAEMLALLSFNRKFSLQFLCSAQIYERIPKKIRDIANYTVICKNVLGADRLFRSYYFSKSDYDESFNGKRAKAQFIREFIADDELYSLYDTLEQIDRMTVSATEEKDKREEAMNILFGNMNDLQQEGEA